jgi:hypothetical protein
VTSDHPKEPNCICQRCDKAFWRAPYHIKKGRGKFCSLICKYGSDPSRPNCVCAVCDKPLYRKANQLRKHAPTCSARCRGINSIRICRERGDFDGPVKNGRGYLVLKRPDHPRANSAGYVLQHIVVAEQHFGIAIGRHLHVHHVDEDKANNEPSNLEVLTQEMHLSHHARQPRLKAQRRIQRTCPVCDHEFYFVPSRPKVHCSQQCYFTKLRA